MEKNRMDKRVKEILESRRIIPSEEGWERIEQQLAGTVQSSNRTFWRLGIAAGFTAFLMISIFWLNRNRDNGLVDEETVVTGVSTEVGTQDTQQDLTSRNPQNIVVFSDSDTEESRDQAPEDQEDRIMVKEEIDVPEMFVVNVDERFVAPEKLDLKVAEVVSQVASLENSGTQVEDEVIDSLLRVAQEQLLKERVLTSPGKVDAMALLSEVEDDLNKSFRDQLFEKLKEGYLKVRTAVLYRND